MFNRNFDNIAGSQIAVGELTGAPRTAGSDHVTRLQRVVSRNVCDEFGYRVNEIACTVILA
ncbi:ureidoglycolate lyase domain protein [Mycobacteroides abscessus 4S-0726-RB]|nr:ureidoglycolate lyase domain protein [Mycobacteroides abscessus 4S-0303]EIT92467.1 ureidoglycolate lyase domain protein [Mycobacteroides abscessus 4S-0726-RB]EIT96016.1 ureidoglycolate lyase domain protein [Mycobacteroides abscessus 4S-0726-RA]EIV09228.1 ureidoglycolate lyase domain protein [Mycobacteroides abscessus 4S-0206]EIV46772.1 ureidoglycolate lyase domain protein [Mycobacteroides abscessus 4S-0116-R]EIV60449.1 ureidoglycolate lyase domain protein [Mycobacteroides abscessus 4S-0116-